ncbi:hypothetical protein CBL_05541 [Carabus blaptoides fortunei]
MKYEFRTLAEIQIYDTLSAESVKELCAAENEMCLTVEKNGGCATNSRNRNSAPLSERSFHLVWSVRVCVRRSSADLQMKTDARVLPVDATTIVPPAAATIKDGSVRCLGGGRFVALLHASCLTGSHGRR